MNKSAAAAALLFVVLLFAACGKTQEGNTSSPGGSQGGAVNVTDAGFEQAIKTDQPVIVEFWSPSCSHCKNMAGTVDALATEMSGKVKVLKVNVLENRDTTSKYGITGLPTFIMLKDG